MPDTIDIAAQAIWDANAHHPAESWTTTSEIDRQHYRRMAQAVIDSLGLAREEQWVPISQSGARWQPRDHGLALAALDLYGVASPTQLAQGFGDPLTHVEHETRLVSPWKRVGAPDV